MNVQPEQIMKFYLYSSISTPKNESIKLHSLEPVKKLEIHENRPL